MPSKPASREEIYYAELIRQLDSMSAAVAAQLGPPPDSEKLTDDQELDMWEYELMPEQFDKHPFPERVKQLAQQGATREAATLAAYPYREILFSTGLTSIRDQVEKAESLAKKSAARREKRMAEQPAEGSY